jgi:hypothetical protein
MAIYRVDCARTYTTKSVWVEANSESDAINKAKEENSWQKYPVDFIPEITYIANKVENKPKEVSLMWASVKDKLPLVGEEAIVITTEGEICFGHIVDKKIAKDYNGWNIPNVEYWLPFVNPKDK